ncbi:MAG: hypothetical protein IBX71_09550 [Candidatus Desulforudis sp.]|nr:hypothetical protein [Desulforudis sp.]
MRPEKTEKDPCQDVTHQKDENVVGLQAGEGHREPDARKPELHPGQSEEDRPQEGRGKGDALKKTLPKASFASLFRARYSPFRPVSRAAMEALFISTILVLSFRRCFLFRR